MTIGRYQRINRPIPIIGKTADNRPVPIICASPEKLLLMQELLPVIRRIDGEWRRVCLKARQCINTSYSWRGRSSVPYDNPFINPDMWPANSSDLHLVCWRMMQQRAYLVNPGCGEIESAICWDVGWMPAEPMAWWIMRLINGKKTGSVCQRRQWSIITVSLFLWYCFLLI